MFSVRFSYWLFDTAIGRCAIAWSERGIARVQLPEADEMQTRQRMLLGLSNAHEAPPPPHAQHAIDAIVRLLRGDESDLSGVALDMDRVSAFDRQVYEVTRTIRRGATLSYGEIADRLGAAGTARAVGQALGRNPFPIVVPCHRVVAAAGKAGGFSAPGGTATKLRLLAIEGAYFF